MRHPDGHIVVVGSVNMDMTLHVARVPDAGETVRAEALSWAPGGKGANQAVAAARLGAPVRMIARVGDDASGESMLRNLKDHGVGTDFVTTAPGTPQGLAVILLERDGQNRIVIAEGSNAALSPADVDAAKSAFDGAAVALLQNEVSMDTSRAAARAGRAAGARVLWNPAPAPDHLPDDLLASTDVLLVNETEAGALSGVPVHTDDDAKRAAEALLARGCGAVVVTLGAAGALWVGKDTTVKVSGKPTKVVDTTGAGDTFAGALGVALMEGRAPEAALHFANAAAAISVTRPGAQGGMPRRSEMPDDV